MLRIPWPRGQRPWRGRAAAAAFTLASLTGSALLVPPASSIPKDTFPTAADTAGTGLLEWVYDSWTVPWVQTVGAYQMLDAASHATLMVLACETTVLERDRLARHLSVEECEHRMAAIRADQDTALIFRVYLRVSNFRRAKGLLQLDPGASFTLEDDRGRHWRPVSVERGPVVEIPSGQRLKRTYDYHPPWLRGAEQLHPSQYEPVGGRSVTVAEHRVRFARHERVTGEPMLSRHTHWLRLRLSHSDYEWAAMWIFRPEDQEP